MSENSVVWVFRIHRSCVNGKQGSVSASMKVQNLCHTQCKFLSPQQKLSQLVVSTDEFAFDANYSDFDMHYEVLNVQTDKIASPSGGRQRRMNEHSLRYLKREGIDLFLLLH